MGCIYICKICKNCKRVLPLIAFHKQNTGKLGRRNICKKCRKELEKDYKKKYRKQHENECKNYNGKYRKENKLYYKNYSAKHRKENKLYYKNYNDKYRKENPTKFFNYRIDRRSKIKNNITIEQWKEMMDFFDWKCAYSGEYIGGNSENRTIDHIVPLNCNGENVIWNLAPMYKPYNSSKRDKDMLSWYIQQPYFSKERLDKIYAWQKYAYDKYYI